MTRSRKKSPAGGIGSGSEKKYRQREHQAERCLVRVLAKRGNDESMPDPKAYGNRRSGPKDGRRYGARFFSKKAMRK